VRWTPQPAKSDVTSEARRRESAPRPVSIRTEAALRRDAPRSEPRRAGNDRYRSSAPRSRPDREPDGSAQRRSSLPPSRGYVEKQGPLRRVLSRLGFTHQD
jgi:hypothetical protein